MSDTSQGPGWWQASDGKWYPPEQAPGYQPPAAGAPMGAAPTGMPAPGVGGTFDVAAALTWSWAKFQANMQQLLILGAVVGGVPLVLAIISGFMSGWFGLALYFISGIVGLVLTMLTVQAGLEIATTGQLNQATLWQPRGNVGNYVLGAIIFGVLEALGICPGLCVGFLFVWLIFGLWQFPLIAEGASGVNALMRSKEITMGLGLGNIFVPMIVFMAVGGAASAFGFGSRYGAVVGVFLLPFSALYGAYLYRTLTGQGVAA